MINKSRLAKIEKNFNSFSFNGVVTKDMVLKGYADIAFNNKVDINTKLKALEKIEKYMEPVITGIIDPLAGKTIEECRTALTELKAR